jgi:alkylhydroperoxidase family enzyme
MAHIRLVGDDEATGRLAEAFDKARGRAGKVFHVVRLMSPNPGVLEASMGMYLAIMKGPSPLPRLERELIATLVSILNKCHY